jgi:hypothetical protein
MFIFLTNFGTRNTNGPITRGHFLKNTYSLTIRQILYCKVCSTDIIKSLAIYCKIFAQLDL